MTITRVGSNNAYAEGWEMAFAGKKRKAAPTDKTAKATKGVKASAKKASGKTVATKAKTTTKKKASKKAAKSK